MRNRAGVVLIENKKIALIRRTRDSQVYYVIPGGGIEKGETPEEAAKREAFEELGLIIKVSDLLFKMEYNGTQYYYIGDIVGGKFGTGTGEEFTDYNKNRGTYEPVWMAVEELSKIDLRPREIVSKIMTGKWR